MMEQTDAEEQKGLDNGATGAGVVSGPQLGGRARTKHG